MVSKTIESEIRQYLESLTKPAPKAKSSIDKDAVRRLKADLKGTTDPIGRLEVAKAIREASEPRQVEPAEHAKLAVFVANGKKWADERGYSAADLQRYAKVPADVLRQAGFALPRVSERRGTAHRAPRIAIEDVLAVARELKSPWRLSDLAARVDRDAGTTRSYVNRLIADGWVKEVGSDDTGRGRPAKLYALSK